MVSPDTQSPTFADQDRRASHCIAPCALDRCVPFVSWLLPVQLRHGLRLLYITASATIASFCKSEARSSACTPSAIQERRQLDGQVDGEGRGCGRWQAWVGAQQGLGFAGPTLEREQNAASRCALTAVRLETNARARTTFFAIAMSHVECHECRTIGGLSESMLVQPAAHSTPDLLVAWALFLRNLLLHLRATHERPLRARVDGFALRSSGRTKQTQ